MRAIGTALNSLAGTSEKFALFNEDSPKISNLNKIHA